MLFFDRVWTVLLETVRRFLLRQSMLDIRMKLGERFLDGPRISWYLAHLWPQSAFAPSCSLGFGAIRLGRIGLGGVSLGRIGLWRTYIGSIGGD